VSVLKVESVEWETYPGNDALDTCPNNGGKRILPDKQNPTDSSAAVRKKVRVKAKITPAVAGQTVYFRVFDVDDPSSSTSPVDSNDGSGATGADNRGASGGLSATSAATDSSGYATVEFTVSIQPGDNFRAFAACSDSALSALTQAQVDSGSIPSGIAQSDMLTVWRRLWLEFDSMGPVASTGSQKNFEEGTIDSVQQNVPAAGQSTLDVGMLLTDEKNRYEGGFIVIDGSAKYTVLKNTDNLVLDDDVVVSGLPPTSSVGKPFAIYDDDYDETTVQPIRPLPYSLSGGTLIESAYGEAYIKPVNVPSGYVDTDSTFYRNLSSGLLSGWTSKVSEKKDLTDAADFWVVHLLAAWQPSADKDYDPDTVDPGDPSPDIVQGEALDSDNTGAIYVEPIRELEILPFAPRIHEEHTVVHEIGHQGGGEHGDGGIMADGAPIDQNQFAPVTLDRFRDETTF